ncbi:hypothetical protein [Moraxella pluranimalium]|uniref:Secreted protein n=1 Tax=Moraxella pluranimalium TaxID=470453 RepID=A0A1T0CMK3_9GAMM|nr:hypothetical protein [Moraxella pluranimalium]OOS23576.1 hypothetical protein B0680_06350 [Moraxella pluranimalium]
MSILHKPKHIALGLVATLSAAAICLSSTAHAQNRVSVGDSIAEGFPKSSKTVPNGVTHRFAKHSKTPPVILKEYIPAAKRSGALQGASVFLSTGLSNFSYGFYGGDAKRAQLEETIFNQIKELNDGGAAMVMVLGVAEDFDSKKGTSTKIMKKTNSHQPTDEGAEMNAWLANIVAKAVNQGLKAQFLGAIPAAETFDDVHAKTSWYSTVVWNYGDSSESTGVMSNSATTVDDVKIPATLNIDVKKSIVTSTGN